MVQKKVSNKLGIQATILLKTEVREFNTNPSDGKIKAPDLKTKKMKKSRSIKRVDRDITLRSSPKTHPTNTPSPKKASPSPSQSPNYMKSTSSSEARKDPNTLSRTSSLKKVRSLTITPTFKHTRTGVKVNRCSKVVLCENLDVQRDTCSSTMKDSNFPPYLELNPGATEAEGTSVMKVCPYNYCSLNGHHHKPRPPLRCFLSSRRKQLKTQKVVKPEILFPCKSKVQVPGVEQNEDFFIEICVPGRDVMQILSEKSCSEIGDTVLSDEEFIPEEDPLTPAKDQTLFEFAYNESEEMDYSGTVSLDDFSCETSDMEWEEGQVNISVQNNDECKDKPGFKSDDNERFHFDDFIAKKLKSYFDEEIMEFECISDADSVPDSESTQPGEEQIEDPFKVEDDSVINSGKREEFADGLISATQDLQSVEEQDSFSSKHIYEITKVGNEGLDLYEESAETHFDETIEDNYMKEDIKEEDNADDVNDEKISSEDMIKDILLEIEDVIGTKEETSMGSVASEAEVNQSEVENDGQFNRGKNNEDYESIITSSGNSKEQNEDLSAEVEEPEMQDINQTEESEVLTIIKDGSRQVESNKFFQGGTDSSQELLDSCSKLRKSIRCKKEEENEEDRKFNPREPNFLPLEPDPEAEKVDLRHQEMDERRNANDWMLDYALQKTVNQLAPARKRKVALLVEAFESVIPVPKYESHLRRNSSGFAHARPIQACR